jgi:hypothetical protein
VKRISIAASGGRMTALARIHLRYPTYKLRALCWILRRMRGGVTVDPRRCVMYDRSEIVTEGWVSSAYVSVP